MKEHKMLRKRSRALGLLMSLTMLAAAVPVQAAPGEEEQLKEPKSVYLDGDVSEEIKEAELEELYADSEKDQEKKRRKDGEGTSVENAVHTFEKAQKLTEGYGTIYICGTVTVSQDSTWYLTDEVTIKRAESFSETLIRVKEGAVLTLVNSSLPREEIEVEPEGSLQKLTPEEYEELKEEQEKPEVTVTPEPTKEPEATVTPEPTKEPEATVTPEPTKEPEVTVTPEPTKEPEATVTPEPTKEPEATVTPEPTKEPEATVTPEPTKEPEATVTPEPTKEPEATVTPEPTKEPEAAETPEITDEEKEEILAGRGMVQFFALREAGSDADSRDLGEETDELVMGDTAKLDDPIPGADEAALKSIAGGTILVGGGDNLYQGSGKVPDKNGNTAGKEEQGTISSGGSASGSSSGNKVTGTSVSQNKKPQTDKPDTVIPKTNDSTTVTPYIILGVGSLVLLIVFGIMYFIVKKKKK